MDEDERARREEIEAKEERIYDKITEVRKEGKDALSEAKKDAKADLKEEADKREEADRRIYQKIEKEKDGLIERIDGAAKALRAQLDALEEKLEVRDREIESHSKERDQEHDKILATMKQDQEGVRTDLDEHVDNERVHNKLHSLQTINEMNRPENLPPPNYMHRRPPEPEPEPAPAEPNQVNGDKYAKLGVPWYFNPMWIGGIMAALAGGAAAFYLVIKQFGGG